MIVTFTNDELHIDMRYLEIYIRKIWEIQHKLDSHIMRRKK